MNDTRCPFAEEAHGPSMPYGDPGHCDHKPDWTTGDWTRDNICCHCGRVKTINLRDPGPDIRLGVEGPSEEEKR